MYNTKLLVSQKRWEPIHASHHKVPKAFYSIYIHIYISIYTWLSGNFPIGTSLRMNQIVGSMSRWRDYVYKLTWGRAYHLSQQHYRLKYENQSAFMSWDSSLTTSSCENVTKSAVSVAGSEAEHLNQSWINTLTSSGSSSCGQWPAIFIECKSAWDQMRKKNWNPRVATPQVLGI